MSYCVRILNESRQGMGLYAAPFWGKSKNWSQVASSMFPAEMAKSIEMSLRNWERWYMCVRQILFRKARAEGPRRPVASRTNGMIVAGVGMVIMGTHTYHRSQLLNDIYMLLAISA